MAGLLKIEDKKRSVIHLVNPKHIIGYKLLPNAGVEILMTIPKTQRAIGNRLYVVLEFEHLRNYEVINLIGVLREIIDRHCSCSDSSFFFKEVIRISKKSNHCIERILAGSLDELKFTVDDCAGLELDLDNFVKLWYTVPDKEGDYWDTFNVTTNKSIVGIVCDSEGSKLLYEKYFKNLVTQTVILGEIS